MNGAKSRVMSGSGCPGGSDHPSDALRPCSGGDCGERFRGYRKLANAGSVTENPLGLS
jgi:hypothetical protein